MQCLGDVRSTILIQKRPITNNKNYPQFQFQFTKRKITTDRHTANMADILLTCNADEFDTALNLVENIQDQLGIYDVTLYVEDDGYDEKFDAQIEESTVLLVFKFGESSISAWVTIKGINMEDSNYEQSPFPESIDFSCVDKGIGIFENILYEDFGLNLAQQETHIPLPYAEMELH